MSSGDTCKFLIDTNEDFWAIGMAAMRGYYVTHDITNDRVGIAPQNDSTKAAIVHDPATSSTVTPLTLPNTSVTTLPTWATITIVVCCVVVIVVVVVVIVLVGGENEDTAETADTILDNTLETIRCQLLDECDESKETAIQTLAAFMDDDINGYAISLLLNAYDSLIELATTTALPQ